MFDVKEYFKDKDIYKTIEGFPVYIDEGFIYLGCGIVTIPMAVAESKSKTIVINTLMAEKEEDFIMAVIYHEIGHLVNSPRHFDVSAAYLKDLDNSALEEEYLKCEIEADDYAVQKGFKIPLMRVLSELAIRVLILGEEKSFFQAEERSNILRGETKNDF